MFKSYMNASMLHKAQDNSLVTFGYTNLREFGIGPHQSVDDTPYGGGDGMLLRADVVVPAIEQAKNDHPSAKVFLMCPQGKTYTQQDARTLADTGDDLILICGRYEGFDERIRAYVDGQISIGNYVVTGGELAAMVVADSVVRLLPGVLGGEQSAIDESFSDGKTLEYPHYTRPSEFRGKSVPEVLISGDHARINKWRKDNTR